MARSGYQEYLCDEGTRLFQMLVGLCSILLGMLVAGMLIHLLPQDVSSIERARELGIISRTVLDGYPKELEVPYYLLGVTVSLVSGLCIFLAVTYYHYKKGKTELVGQGSHPAPVEEKPKPSMGLVRWVVLALILFLVTFHRDFIYKNWYWWEWGFFFEEGIYLRWINELLRGNILYKDIYFYAGPFMLWPQYWLMKLFGSSIVLDRCYIYSLYFIGYLIVFKVLRQIVNGKMLMLIGMFFIVYFYYPMFPSVHVSLGRFAVSLFPLYFLYQFFFNKRVSYLLITGLSLGFALLYSQELGIGSLVAAGMMLGVFNYREGERIKCFLRESSFVAAGALVLPIPVLAYFLFHHALADLYEAMVNLPRYYAVGAWGLQFPNLFRLLTHPEVSRYGAVETLLAYWPMSFYIGSVFFCLTLFLRRSYTNRAILFFGVATLGGIIFQRAFGIYSLFQIKSVIYPLVILSCAYLDMAWPRARYLAGNRSVPGRKVEMQLYAALLIFIALGLCGYSQRRGFSPSFTPHAYRTGLSKRNEEFVPLDLPRARNVYMPPQWAHKTKRVVEYIEGKTAPDEPIFVFPFSPMYYFLADRPSATKYPAIYAVLKRTREQTIRELEEKRIRYIVYIQHWPVLKVPTETRFPQITEYIDENYQTEKRFDDTFILRRKHRPEP